MRALKTSRVSPLKTVLNYYHLILAGTSGEPETAARILAEHVWPYGDGDDRELLESARRLLYTVCEAWARQLEVDVIPNEGAKNTYLFLRCYAAIRAKDPIPERILQQVEERGMLPEYAKVLQEGVQMVGLAPDQITSSSQAG